MLHSGLHSNFINTAAKNYKRSENKMMMCSTTRLEPQVSFCDMKHKFHFLFHSSDLLEELLLLLLSLSLSDWVSLMFDLSLSLPLAVPLLSLLLPLELLLDVPLVLPVFAALLFALLLSLLELLPLLESEELESSEVFDFPSLSFLLYDLLLEAFEPETDEDEEEDEVDLDEAELDLDPDLDDFLLADFLGFWLLDALDEEECLVCWDDEEEEDPDVESLLVLSLSDPFLPVLDVVDFDPLDECEAVVESSSSATGSDESGCGTKY